MTKYLDKSSCIIELLHIVKIYMLSLSISSSICGESNKFALLIFSPFNFICKICFCFDLAEEILLSNEIVIIFQKNARISSVKSKQYMVMRQCSHSSCSFSFEEISIKNTALLSHCQNQSLRGREQDGKIAR